MLNFEVTRQVWKVGEYIYIYIYIYKREREREQLHHPFKSVNGEELKKKQKHLRERERESVFS